MEITIKVYLSSEGDGFFYDIYDTNDIDENTESVDGGFCTSTLENALEMAKDQTVEFIKRFK